MNNSTKRNCKIERTMMTQRNREAKKIKVNLNYLRKDLDIWHHQVVSWLDAKSQPQQHEIEKFGIEDVQKLCIIKHVCQQRLDFDDEEDGYKFESLANEYLDKFRDLKNIMDRKKDACLDCERKEHYMHRYKAERNELKVDRQRLEKLLANRTEERNDLAQKLKKIELDNAKLEDKNKKMESQLDINNNEKSSITNDNKELKNILQKKLSEVKRLETRLQQYVEKFNDIQVQKRRMEKLQSENDELNQKCNNLQTVEKNVQKLKKEKQQLETEMISQRQNIVTLNSRVKIVNDDKLELEDRLRLQIDNIEKSSILKETEELKSAKNLLQEKLSELKRLETRVKQYAEKFEDIPVLKRHMDKLQKDNDELNQKCTHLQKVVKDVQKLNREKIQLETDNISQRQDNETLNSRLEMLNVEKLEIEDRLRLQDDEVELLFNSLETERQEHESAMKKLEMLYVAVQNECVELLLKLQKIHSSSEISFEKLNSVIDKDMFGQKLEETTAQENTLAKDTTKILENFASAKDKKGCIEVLKKRFEKSLPKCDNGISSAEKTDMEDNTSNSSCTKYYEETVKERKSTCHNRIHRTTNVTNFNIAGSNVSFNENTQQLSRLNGNNGQFPAIEEGN